MANVIDKVAGLVVGPQGPQGPQGPKGDTGQTGPQGAQGATGATPNLTMGTVTTLEPDSQATATITGTAENPVLNLGLPKGRTGEVSQAEFDEVAGDVTKLKEDLTQIVERSNTYLPMGEFSSGYMGANGSPVVQSACKYATITISSEYVGETLFVAGTAWYDVIPYVFVGADTTKVTPNIPSAGSTLTQYTDLEFVPTQTGTLYVNKFDSGSTHHTANAYYKPITAVKSDLLPQPLPVKDVINYNAVSLTMVTGKLLDGSTGVISDSDQSIYRVSDYTAITGGAKVLITTQHYYGQGLYAFYDSSKTFISGASSVNSGTPTKLYAEIVDVPDDASYIVIGHFYQQNLFPVCYLWEGVKQYALPSQIWTDKKWCVLGDSLTENNTKASVHYHDFVRASTGITVTNLAVSGCGYAKGSDNFMAQSQNVPVDSDVITIFGSFNDLSSGLDLGTVTDTGTSTIAGCINTTLDNIQAIIPLANIGVIAPTPWHTTQPSTSGNAYNYVEMIKAICARRSIPFLDLWRCSNLRPWDADFKAVAYTHDNGGGVHPDEHGHMLIAPRFKAFLETLLM